jgi:hypothetical protein
MAKRSHPEDDPDDCICFVCLDVLLDPVTLACGHTLDQRCLLRVVATASSGAGQRSCPMCRAALPETLPGVNVKLRRTVEARHPEQVQYSVSCRTRSVCSASLRASTRRASTCVNLRASCQPPTPTQRIDPPSGFQPLLAAMRRWRAAERPTSQAARGCLAIGHG